MLNYIDNRIPKSYRGVSRRVVCRGGSHRGSTFYTFNEISRWVLPFVILPSSSAHSPPLAFILPPLTPHPLCPLTTGARSCRSWSWARCGARRSRRHATARRWCRSSPEGTRDGMGQGGAGWVWWGGANYYESIFKWVSQSTNGENKQRLRLRY